MKPIAKECLLKHFQTHSLKGFGIEEMHSAIIAAGAVLHYLKDTEHPNLQHITSIQRIDREDYLWMDRFTIRNLELIGSGLDSNRDNGTSLLKVLDNTISPMGARMLKRWIVLPLKDLHKIQERLDLTEFFIKETDLRYKVSQHIKQCGDVERLVSKIALKKINPREVLQIAKGLQHIEALREIIANTENEYLKRISDALNPCHYIKEKILKELNENPPALVSRGGVFREGVNFELDELRRIAHGGKEYLVELQQKEALSYRYFFIKDWLQ